MKEVEYYSGSVKFTGAIINGKLFIEEGVLRHWGWFWSYGNEMPGLFFVRMMTFRGWDNFWKSLTEQGVTAKMVADVMRGDPKGTLYGLSGDNSTWYFGELFDAIDENWEWELRNAYSYGVIDIGTWDMDRLLDEFWIRFPSVTSKLETEMYEKFSDEVVKKLNPEAVETIEDVFDILTELKQDILEWLHDTYENILWEKLKELLEEMP